MKTATLPRPAPSRKPAPKSLRRFVETGLNMRKEVLAATLPTFDVNNVCETYGLKRDQISRMTGFSPRTVATWAAGEPLTTASAQKVREMRRLLEAMAHVVQPKFIGPWLQQPNSAFDGALPIQLIERGEADLLWRMIYDLASGDPG